MELRTASSGRWLWRLPLSQFEPLKLIRRVSTEAAASLWRRLRKLNFFTGGGEEEWNEER